MIVLLLGHYGLPTIRNYLSELRYLFVYYADANPADFTEDMTMEYLLYLARTLKCNREKCKMEAQSISFFFRYVLKKVYVIANIYVSVYLCIF